LKLLLESSCVCAHVLTCKDFVGVLKAHSSLFYSLPSLAYKYFSYNTPERDHLGVFVWYNCSSVSTANSYFVLSCISCYSCKQVSLHERRLNGILADEMGLGKTIQTISLLAYLACYRGLWGPHLIVVPTSCLVNWETELKKWCPAFKVLTYYGSKKERADLRVGWTKPNTFHVCVTSYQLVVQDASAFRRKKWCDEEDDLSWETSRIFFFEKPSQMLNIV